MQKWEKWNKDFIEKVHGKVNYYRDLYEGNHSDIFQRAQDLIKNGEITDNIIHGPRKAQNVQTPYIMANISKLIPEIPAMLVSRSIGAITSSVTTDNQANEETEDQIDTPDSEEVENPQQELIEQIERNTNLKFEHWGNMVQQQVDGGLVGVVINDDRGLRLDFKQRDVYYPHDDGLGADLAYEREFKNVNGEYEDYLHVYRERVEENGLQTAHMLFKVVSDETESVEEDEAKELLGLDELEKFYEGRTRPFIVYWPNEKTFTNPLGVSCLKGQEGKQDEINWTLTRNALTFERNGKPRIVISQEILEALQDKAHERYGDESKIDHRDLEITTFDSNGRGMEVVQIDVSKIGDIEWVKDLVRFMLTETKTSQKAVDLFLDSGGAAESGKAKFYDLLTSILKSEQLQGEYIYFLKQLFENCLWLANDDDPNVVIEEPDIQLKDMIPISRQELMEENATAYMNGTQSLETTIRRSNPHASEEWIQEELTKVEEGAQSDDTTSLLNTRSTLQNFMDNRNAQGQVIEDES